VRGRLEELARQFGLPPAAIDALEAILVLQADDPRAPTAVREPGEAVDRHVADSLVALDLPEVRGARAVADLGAGAGWPGLALAAALPGARVALVESAARHCRYLEKAVTAAGLRNVEVVHARAESWSGGLEAHDLVTSRALAALPVLCEYAAPLLAAGGSLVAWKGAVSESEASAAATAAEAVGLEPVEPRAVRPYEAAERLSLHAFVKVAPTPSRFPRRPGVALRRPLGG
jgi:16S rRNA (guanine527-N7)-methyltransferase